MFISIIVPVLNEAALIQSFLRQLRKHAPGAEVIIVDGGSTDTTRQLAEGFCDRVLQAERGRAQQLNAGAKVARGDVLWFLHVDAEVPDQCLDEIRQLLQNRDVAGGFFRIRLPRPGFVYRLTDCFAHYAGLLLRMRCGDHGMFCRREAFESIGGFPEVPLMEDVEFFRKLRRRGSVPCIKSRIVVSTRRYEEIGPLRLSLAYGFIALLYAVGAPISLQARIYERACCRSK